MQTRQALCHAVSQHHLHALVGALYSGSIKVNPTVVEPLLRTADYLQMPCLSAACVAYIRKHLVKSAPVEVRLRPPSCKRLHHHGADVRRTLSAADYPVP